MALATEPIRVLHVDDDPDFADLVASFLERELPGATVLTATDPRDGLEVLSDRRIDCVVADYDMPRIDGLAFLDTVREDHPSLPFILFTGKGSEEIASEAISRGVTDYMQKAGGTEQYEVLANRIENAVATSRSEAAVERTQRRYQRLVEESTDAIVVVDQEAIIQYASPAAERVLGRTPEQLVGTNGLEPIHEEERPAVASTFEELAQTPGSRRSVEFRYLRPDDAVIWAEARGRNLIDDPAVGGIVVYTRDITARKQRERRLEELHDATRELFTVTDAEAILERVSSAVKEVLDLPLHGVWRYDDESGALVPTSISTPGETAFGEHPTYTANEASLSWDAYQAGETRRYGDVSTVEGRYNPDTKVRSELIVPIGEYGVLNVGSTEPNDLSEGDELLAGILAANAEVALDRLEREETIAAERERFRAVFEDAFDAMVIADDDGRYVDANASACALFGLEYDELIGKTVEDFLAPGVDFEEYWETFQAATADRGQIPLVTANGRRLTVEYAATADIVPGQHLSILRDVTERSEHQASLERQNRRLEEFASVVSHDIRNPLNVAMGNLDLATETCDAPELETARDALDRIDALIEDLLTLAREGADVTDVEPVGLAALVESCWGTVETKAATLEIEADLTLTADRSRLQQLLENLIRNAIEHAGPDVTVRVGPLTDEVGFYVADDGPGIPQAERDRVLEPGVSTIEAGTGFGLSIVRRIADAHGWDLRIGESDVGGARIEFVGVDIRD